MDKEKAVDKIMAIIADKKVCVTCGKEKPINEYYQDKYKKDGRKSRCKECNALYDKENNKKKKQRLSTKKESYKIILDFSSVKFGKDLLEKLKNDSDLNLRTIENEIFFILKDII